MSLIAEPQITCQADVYDEEEGMVSCGRLSRFRVERSDGDESYGSNGGSEETCEAHLTDAVCGMVDGCEDVSAVVLIRWTPNCGACGRPALRKDGTWEHAEAADAVACSIFRGVPLTVTEASE